MLTKLIKNIAYGLSKFGLILRPTVNSETVHQSDLKRHTPYGGLRITRRAISLHQER